MSRLRITRMPAICLMAGLLGLLSACTQAPPVPEPEVPSLDSVALSTAVNPPALPLSVAIGLFEARTAVPGSLYDSLAQVRSVERRYVPYQLRLTLDRSGWFGAVRVMPIIDPGVELTIHGELLESDGVHLALAIRVEDASGRTWIDREYRDRASVQDYLSDPVYTVDPFQGLYNQIANDIIEVYRGLAADDVQQLVDIATMRYAAMLSPDYFSRYVDQTEGNWLLTGLPAENDPALDRVLRIRDSEHLFSDSVDENYQRLYRDIGPTYAWWRYYSFELIMGNQRLESIDPTRGASRGSWYSLERIYKTYKESRMNEDALRELSDAFDRETTPTVTEVAGQVVELKGTLAEQHDDWRALMKRFYEAAF